MLAHPGASRPSRPAPWEHLNPKGRTRREDPRSSRMMVVGTAMSFLMQSLPTTVRVALFVESDFVVSVSPASAQSQLIAAVAMVARGARVVRLQNTRGIGRPSGIPQATCCAPTALPDEAARRVLVQPGGGSWRANEAGSTSTATRICRAACSSPRAFVSRPSAASPPRTVTGPTAPSSPIGAGLHEPLSPATEASTSRWRRWPNLAR